MKLTTNFYHWSQSIKDKITSLMFSTNNKKVIFRHCLLLFVVPLVLFNFSTKELFFVFVSYFLLFGKFFLIIYDCNFSLFGKKNCYLEIDNKFLLLIPIKDKMVSLLFSTNNKRVVFCCCVPLSKNWNSSLTPLCC